MKKYLYPKHHFVDGGEAPALNFKDKVYQSGELVDINDEDYAHLSKFIVFEDVADSKSEKPKKDVKEVPATETPVEASAPTDNLPVDQGIPVTDKEASETPNTPAKR